MKSNTSLILIFSIFFSSCIDNNRAPTAPLKQEYATFEFYKGKENQKKKHIVLISGDEEYRSEECLPQLAKILSQHHGFDCTVLFAQDPKHPGIINPNFNSNIPNLDRLESADLMVLFTRFRALGEDQMKYIDHYLFQGKPLLAIRTATHAFNYEDKSHPYAHYSFDYQGEKEAWQFGFGKLILGETWYTHHGHHKHQSTRGIIPTNADNNPILNGIPNGSIWGPTDVYGIRTPISNAQHLLLGQSIDREGEFSEDDLFYGMKEADDEVATNTQSGGKLQDYNPNQPMPPIVWEKPYQIPEGKTGRSITSTIGSSTDFLDKEVRRLMVNASFALLNLEVPTKANVSIVGSYSPSAFKFHDDRYWLTKKMSVGQ